MQKCLVVQFEPRHEEVIPAVIHACNAAGYRPTVLLNRRIKRMRGDIFDLVETGEADIRYGTFSTDDLGSGWVDDLVNGMDFVLLNTFNRVKTAEWAKACGKPVIAIIHNVDQFMGKSSFRDTLSRHDFAYLTLGAHVTSELISRLDGQYIDCFGQLAPVLMPKSAPQYQVPDLRRVVIQGNMSMRTRDYENLIEVLADSPRKWRNLTFEFPSSGADREAIAAKIKSHGLDNRMRILSQDNGREVAYDRVFDSLSGATMFHPLIPPGFAKYQRTKITSTTSMSVSFGVPVVMDRWSEACYRFPMLVADNTLSASLDRLSQVEAEELQEIHSALETYRARAVERSGQDVARLVGRVLQ